jgi:hypothetical protein
MFTIPFLQKYARSTFVAVILGAVIWGFAHSNYPAQPFYIRGIEVSIGGIIIGYVFLRYGFLAVLIWHFSVDAVYSAAVLVQSGNAYYVTTGVVSAGVIALPLVYSIVSAIRRRGFVPADALTNARDVSPAVVAEEEAVEEPPRPVLAHSPTTARAKLVGLGLIAVGVVLFLVTIPQGRPHLARFDAGRTEAMEAARAFLDEEGFALAGYRPVASAVQFLGDRRDGRTYAYGITGSKIVPTYLFEEGGRAAVDDVYTGHMSPSEWRVRFFKPLEKTEYNVYIDGATGAVSGLSFELPDTASLPSLDQGTAMALAQRFLRDVGRSVAGFEAVDRMTEERENRSDHTFRFQAGALGFGDSGADAAGEAHLVYNVTVHGDHVGSYNADVKIPEEWSREHRKDTVMEAVGIVAIVVLILGLIAAWIVTVVKVMRSSRPRWKLILLGAGAMTVVYLVELLNTWPTVYLEYETSVPIGSFLSSTLMGDYFVSTTALFALFVLLFASAAMMHADAFRSLRAPNRAPLARDALLSGGATLGVSLLLHGLNNVAATRAPSVGDWSRFSAPDVDVASVGVAFAASVCLSTAIWFLLVVAAQYMYRRYLTTRRKKVTVLTAAAVLLIVGVGGESGVVEFLAQFVTMGAAIVALLLLWRLFWRDNPVALLVGVFILSVAEDGYALAVGGSAYRAELWIAVAVLAMPLVFLAVESRRRSEGGA